MNFNPIQKIAPMFFVFLSLMAGTLAGWNAPAPFWGYLIAGAFISVLLFVLFKPNLFLVLICLTGFLTAEVRMAGICHPDFPADHIIHFTNGKYFDISGIITSLPRVYSHKTQYTMACRAIGLKDQPMKPVHGQVILTLYQDRLEKSPPLLNYGQHVNIHSRIRPIRNFANPGGYDYEFRMRLRGVVGSVYATTGAFELTDKSSFGMILSIIRSVQQYRTRFSDVVQACIPESSPVSRPFYFAQAKAALLALTTGQKESIHQEIRDDFSKAGLSHLLAVSGFHLSMIALGAWFIFITVLNRFKFLIITGWARKIACILTLIPLAAYSLFTGFSPSTQRALIMAAVFLTAILLEKEKDPLNALFIAASLILAIDPGALFSISFQLSFTCVFFIISGFTFLYKLGWMPSNKWVKSIFSIMMTTVFAALGTIPITAVYFNTVSFIQVFTNLIMVPVTGFICLPLGLAAIILMDILPFFPKVMIVTDIHILARLLEWIHYISSLDWTWAQVVTPRISEIVIYYLLIVTGISWVNTRNRQVLHICFILLTAGGISLGQGLWQRFYPGVLKVHILDVGQGNAAVIRTPDGRTLLIDAGGFGARSSFDTGRFIVGPFLLRHWIKTLDAVILTHPESDHMQGLVCVFNSFKVRLWIRNSDTNPVRVFKALTDLAREKHIPVQVQKQNQKTFNLGGVDLTVRGPAAGFLKGNRNNNSLVSRLEYQHFSMLFPGDIESETEARLASNPNVTLKDFTLKSDLLLAPHHGSKSSSSKIFLDKVRPRGVIISCGYMNRYGFPDPSVLARYHENNIRIYRTDLMGAVTITSDGNRFTIQTQRKL